MLAELTLYADGSWMCPSGFHAMVALEEKRLSYNVQPVSIPIAPDVRAKLQAKAILASVPILVHGEAWISESSAISEYLAETFPSSDGYPRLFPADLADRARCRQVMSWLRTNLSALRADRPTTQVFGRPTVRPMGEQAKVDAEELLRVAGALVKPGQTTLFAQWCIADIDLALALMRMVGSQDQVPEHLITYALAQWDRRSVKRYVAHVPTSP